MGKMISEMKMVVKDLIKYLGENTNGKYFSYAWNELTPQQLEDENIIKESISTLFAEGAIAYYITVCNMNNDCMSKKEYLENVETAEIGEFMQNGQHDAADIFDEFCAVNKIDSTLLWNYIIENYSEAIKKWLIEDVDYIVMNINDGINDKED